MHGRDDLRWAARANALVFGAHRIYTLENPCPDPGNAAYGRNVLQQNLGADRLERPQRPQSVGIGRILRRFETHPHMAPGGEIDAILARGAGNQSNIGRQNEDPAGQL